MQINTVQKVLIAYLVILLGYWFSLHFFIKTTTGFHNLFFSFMFSLVPFLGGFFGLFLSKYWGWLKSSVGRAVFFVSLGSFSWGFGSMIWSYFNFFKDVVIPYPSIADVGFLACVVFWTIGIINLSYATGAHSGFKKGNGKLILLSFPFFITLISYYLLVHVARAGVLVDLTGGYLKLFFDLAYPISDVVILTLALLIFSLSVNYLGGKYKLSILSLLAGLVLMYFADFVFSYTTTIGTFYNGDFGDLLFTTALWLICFGTLGFSLPNKELKE